MRNKPFASQKGAAILILLMIIVIAGSTLALSISNNNRSPFLQQEIQTRDEAFRAKEALLAYAMQYADLYADEDGNDDNEGPGRLPCPDLDNSGAPAVACSTATTRLGRLPQLDLPGGSPYPFNNVFAGIDRQFWYAVSADFNTSTGIVNSNPAAATLTLDGQPGYVAVLIAPGDIVASQTRSSDTDPEAYLEGGNESSSTAFFNSYAADPDNFNDRVLGITRNELMSLVTVKVAEEVRQTLHQHHLGNNGGLLGLLSRLLPPVTAPLINIISGLLGITVATNSYPEDNTVFPNAVCIISCAFISVPLGGLLGNQPLFSVVMNDAAPDWYFDDGWDALTEPNYTRNSADQTTFSFTGCSINFRVVYLNMGTPTTSDDVSELRWPWPPSSSSEC